MALSESRARLKRMSQSLLLEMKQDSRPRQLKKKVETAHGSALSAIRVSAKLDAQPSISSVLTSQSAPNQVPGVDDEESWLVVWGKCFSNNTRKEQQHVRRSLSQKQKSTAVPWRIPGISLVVDIACADEATLFIDADGQCGLLLSESPEKKKIIHLPQRCIKKVAAGRETALLADDRGCLWQIDLMRRRNFEAPCRVILGQFKAAVVACGSAHCLVATMCGALFTWGEASAGQLGQGDTPNALKTPRGSNIKPLRVWLQDESRHIFLASCESGAVSCGAHHSAAVSTDGSLWTWGWTEHGRLGRSEILDSSLLDDGKPSGTPARVAVFDSGDKSPEVDIFIRAVACGAAHTVSLSARGHVYACGWNEHGQAAGHINATALPIPTRVQLPVDFNAISLAAGLAHTVALDNMGRAMAWGFGEDGQLGQGTEGSSAEPVLVASNTSLAAIACTGTRSAAVACKVDNAPSALATALEKRQAKLRAAPAAAIIIQKRVRGIHFRVQKRQVIARHAALAAGIRLTDWRELSNILEQYRTAICFIKYPIDSHLVQVAEIRVLTLLDTEASNVAISSLIFLAKLEFDKISIQACRFSLVNLQESIDQDKKYLLHGLQSQLETRASTLIQAAVRAHILAKSQVHKRSTALRQLSKVLNAFYRRRRERRLGFENQQKRRKSCLALQAASRGKATRKRLLKEAAARVERYRLESDSAIRLQCLVRKIAARKRRRKRAKLKDKAKKLRVERERVIEKQRQAQLAERQQKLSQARQRRNSLDARLAREAARAATSLLADLVKKDAEEAAQAAAQAVENAEALKKVRHQQRLLRSAQRRKAEAAALAAAQSQKKEDEEEPEPPCDDDHSFYHDILQQNDDQVHEDLDEQGTTIRAPPNKEEKPISFSQYATSLKRISRRPSCDNLIPEDLEQEADPSVIVVNNNSKLH